MWYTPKTNKSEYGLNPERVWYNMMGEEIRQGFIVNDLQAKDQTNLTLKDTSNRSRLKNDVTFTYYL
jgi:hypothetical protein